MYHHHSKTTITNSQYISYIVGVMIYHKEMGWTKEQIFAHLEKERPENVERKDFENFLNETFGLAMVRHLNYKERLDQIKVALLGTIAVIGVIGVLCLSRKE